MPSTDCGLQKIDLPENLKTIGAYAFASNGFSQGGDLVLPEGLKTVGSHAFYRDLNFKDTSGFTSLTIPASVESIEEYAFYNHQRMDTVTVAGKQQRRKRPVSAGDDR